MTVRGSQQPQKTCSDTLVYLCTYFDYINNNRIIIFNINEYCTHN